MPIGLKLIVGAESAEQVAHVKNCLLDWERETIVLDDEGTLSPEVLSSTPRLILLYARKDEEGTLSICRQLREAPATAGAPILVAISRYEIVVGNRVRDLGNADFIIRPFDEHELRSKARQLLT